MQTLADDKGYIYSIAEAAKEIATAVIGREAYSYIEEVKEGEYMIHVVVPKRVHKHMLIGKNGASAAAIHRLLATKSIIEFGTRVRFWLNFYDKSEWKHTDA